MRKYLLALLPALVSLVLVGLGSPSNYGMAMLAGGLVILGSLITGVIVGIDVYKKLELGTAWKIVVAILAFAAAAAAYFGACFGGCILIAS